MDVRLTPDQRAAVFETYELGLLSKSELARQYGVSRQSLHKLILRMRLMGTTRRTRRDRKSLTDDMKESILTLLRNDSEATVGHVVDMLKSESNVGSHGSVCKYLKSIGWKRKVDHVKPFLSGRAKSERLQYVQARIRAGHLPTDVYLDETSRGSKRRRRTRSWSERGDSRVRKQTMRFPTYQLSVFMRGDGLSSYLEQTGTTATDYITTLRALNQSGYLPAGARLFHDKAASHTARVTTSWLASHHITGIQVPTKSPDLMVVESMHRRMDEIVGTKRFRDRQDMQDSLCNALDFICDAEDCTKYWNHVENNWRRVRTRRGDNDYRQA